MRHGQLSADATPAHAPWPPAAIPSHTLPPSASYCPRLPSAYMPTGPDSTLVNRELLQTRCPFGVVGRPANVKRRRGSTVEDSFENFVEFALTVETCENATLDACQPVNCRIAVDEMTVVLHIIHGRRVNALRPYPTALSNLHCYIPSSLDQKN
ncbi:hypothetical protein K437DRAFT_256538 [Tilletiaria anomala UBC 951]|uniref:Uncharacterized protein n=1 Tax=Tilletiaria anomala (strain ATCC 24038 / CBS 436.72 / UBC 951) TaxID=1037660 RepID=A0A066VVT5_TILAU|nr:uncharacterized protein K437DRAFT_256538 [Tilletiaria anomala UBC 951]KDN45611.1 hypothetical protein K437DRAFT_256538 [Tilletiaria anomala UBC 951]